MQTVKANVKSKGQVVGVASFPQFDTLEEATSQIGADAVLKLTNVQLGTNAKNEVRAAATGKPPKKRIRQLAHARLTEAELLSTLGQEGALDALLEQKMAEVEAELEEERRQLVAASVEAGDAGEDDEDEDD
jgi:hypothetical protein